MGDTPEPLSRLPDLRAREILAIAPLIALVVLLGVYPRLARDVIDAASWL